MEQSPDDCHGLVKIKTADMPAKPEDQQAEGLSWKSKLFGALQGTISRPSTTNTEWDEQNVLERFQKDLLWTMKRECKMNPEDIFQI